MPPTMKDNKWYVVDVPIPDTVTTPQETREFLVDMAKKLAKKDNQNKFVKTSVDEPPAAENPPPVTPKPGFAPLYVCHNKM